ncbi:MAG: TolC family protein [Methylococcales bacterium]|nr:TolC family protein [Methylococcales bacterium]
MAWLSSASLCLADTPPCLPLDTALALAVADNPNLAQLQARAKALAAIPSQVDALPDPTLSLKALNLPVDSFDIGQEAMTQLQFGLTQTLPFPGKRELTAQAAQFDAAAASRDIDEARTQLLHSVSQSWWALWYLDHVLEIIEANQALLKQFVDIALTQYQVGEGLQQDVLLAQLEQSQLLNQKLQFTGARQQTLARLNALLNRPSDTPITPPPQPDKALPTLLPEAQLLTRAEQHRAQLAARHAQVQAAQARLQRAEQDYYPDLTLGIAYGVRDNTPAQTARADFLSVQMSVNVPVFFAAKQDQQVVQRSQELARQKYLLQDQWNQIRADIASAASRFQQAKSQVTLFKTGIIPQARQTVASMLAGYQVGKVDFLNLVRSQIALHNHQTQYWQALSQARQSIAELTALVGAEVIDAP